MPGKKCTVNTLWKGKLEHKFNCISLGNVFRYPGSTLVLGCEDGVVRNYELPALGPNLAAGGTNHNFKSRSSLETKGGPIQTIAIHDVTKFYSNDLIVADSRGTVTVFCNQQILNRKAVAEQCINCLQVQQDPTGNIAIVTSDGEGHISAFSPYNDLWRIRLTDIKQLKGIAKSPQVRCLLAVELMTSHGLSSDYILAADNCRHVFVIHQGTVVKVLNTPANITAMAAGVFLDPDQMEGSQTANGSAESTVPATQVALGSDSGAIFVMSNFELYYEELANVLLPLKHLQVLPRTESQLTDTLLCAGHFNGICILHNGKVVSKHEMTSWVNSMVTADIDSDGQLEAVVGCMDNTIHGLKVCLT